MMRIHRIRIANVAGVTKREIIMAEQGITLISGQNETGKSTLFLALQALLDHPEDASHREIKALKPLHTGHTPEVEADLTIGAYRFTYAKSFAKGKAGRTQLRIMEPVAESLTGRDAHDRVTAIIDQHLDRALWEATRLTQGNMLGQPALSGVRSLSAALDRAVGNDIAGPREDNLLERTEKEFLRYWTPGGKPNRDALVLEEKMAAANSIEQGLRGRLQELQADITIYKGKIRELVTANGQTVGLSGAYERAVAGKSRLDEMSRGLQLKSLTAIAKSQAAEMASSDATRRRNLVDEIGVAGVAVQTAADQRDQARELPDRLAFQVTALERDSGAARRVLIDEVAALELADRDMAYKQDGMDLTLLKLRLQAIDDADTDAAAADMDLNSLSATAESVTELSRAATEIEVARAKLGAASPKVAIHALANVRIRLNDATREVVAGQTLSASPGNRTRVQIDDLAEMTVTGADDVSQLERDLEAATMRFQQILDELGVSTYQEAEAHRHQRERAADRATAARRAVKQHLFDLTRDQMREMIAHLETAMASYLVARQNGADLIPESLAAAKATAEMRREAVRAARSVAEQADASLRKATADHATSNTAAAVAEAKWSAAVAQHSQKAETLEVARGVEGDDELERAATTATQTANRAVADRDAAESEYLRADPALAEAALVAAERARANHEANLRRLQEDVQRLKMRLEVHGDEGLDESLQQAERDVFLSADAVERFRRQARASELLHETLTRCRDAAQKSYVAPLRNEIERLGKHVFGEEFRVVINESLEVDARVMNGVTIPYHSLSSGAKEQIGILQRLATARIVGSGGVPLVLDDAVAYSDNLRQESLAVALGLASSETQTIIITCTPEKYAHAPIEARFDI